MQNTSNPAGAPPKKKKIKVPKVVNGIDTLVEVEVDDVAGPTWGARADHKLLNTELERLDGPAKATGMARYSYDVRLPGMLYGRILHSPHASAEVVSIDTSAAEKIDGVKAVINNGKRTLKYEGDPVAAVATVTPEIAEDAIRAIKVEYKKLPMRSRPGRPPRPTRRKCLQKATRATCRKATNGAARTMSRRRSRPVMPLSSASL